MNVFKYPENMSNVSRNICSWRLKPRKVTKAHQPQSLVNKYSFNCLLNCTQLSVHRQKETVQ